MKFDWDPAKSEANVQKHKVHFETAVEAFADDSRVDFDVTRETDGEIRRKVVGCVGERLFTLVYTVRNGRVRVISARPANAQEAKRYGYRYLYR